jgi:sugar lactone lactonase YvrE
VTDITGGRSLDISIDQTEAITWPFDWYFRDMKNYKYFTADRWDNAGAGQNIVSPNVAVILASSATEGKPAFQEFIKDKYTTQRYVLNWWFPETAYKKSVTVTNAQGVQEVREEGDFGTAWSWLSQNGFDYILYRNPGLPLGSRDFYLHVRNDLAAKTGFAAPAGASGPTTGNNGPNPEGPIYGMFDLRPAGVERGEFNLPRGITRNAQGNFYVVDTVNMRIQKFDPTGKFLMLIGNGRGEGDGQFKALAGDSGDIRGTGPSGVAVDSEGNIYVADTWNHRVQKFGPAGNFLTRWGEFVDLGSAEAASDPARDSKFYGPRGVAIGPGDNLYVSDTGNKRIVIFDKTGKYVRQISSGLSPERRQQNYPFTQPGEMNEPIGVAVDGAGNVYVADTLNKRIQKFDANGGNVGVWPVTGQGWDPGEFLEPFVALDAQGTNLYVSAPTSKQILKYNTADGTLLGQKATEGAVTLKLPTGLTVGADGTLYVVDTNANGVVNLGQMP